MGSILYMGEVTRTGTFLQRIPILVQGELFRFHQIRPESRRGIGTDGPFSRKVKTMTTQVGWRKVLFDLPSCDQTRLVHQLLPKVMGGRRTTHIHTHTAVAAPNVVLCNIFSACCLQGPSAGRTSPQRTTPELSLWVNSSASVFLCTSPVAPVVKSVTPETFGTYIRSC